MNRNTMKNSWRAGLLLSATALISACGVPGPTSSSSMSSTSSTATMSSSSSSTGTTIPGNASFVYAVNVGGNSPATLNGVQYEADRFSTGGSPQTVDQPIAGTNEDALYQSERYGTYSYEIPVTNATYSLKLHFAELYQTTGGSRSFNVAVEGAEKISNLDIYDEVGQYTAYDVVIPSVTVSDKSLSISLTTNIDNATISGFAIYSSNGGKFVPPIVVEPVSGDITVDTATKYQMIDGFGGALPMWSSSTWSSSETQKLVGMGNDQLGMSIVRTIIRPSQNDWSRHVSALQAAKQYGSELQILASPWTPPANWKSNNDLNNGGKLLTSRYGDYANHLNSYVKFMADRNVKIDVTSLQNEPNWHPNYESCDWSGNEYREFLKGYGSQITGTKLMVGETIGFQREYTDPTLNDSTAASKVDYIGGHLYGPWNVNTHSPAANLSRYNLAEQKGKHVWMTEWNYHAADNINGSEPKSGNSSPWADQSNQKVWNETLDDVMASIHYSMESYWNAYIWWWAKRYYSFIGESRGEAYLTTPNGQILKRGWAFSQFSKYVRPGYTRVKVSKSGAANSNNLLITAYQGDDNKIAIVIINKDSSDKNNVTIGLPVNATAASYTYTSRTAARTEGTVSTNGQRATINIPARSISTVVISY